MLELGLGPRVAVLVVALCWCREAGGGRLSLCPTPRLLAARQGSWDWGMGAENGGGAGDTMRDMYRRGDHPLAAVYTL